MLSELLTIILKTFLFTLLLPGSVTIGIPYLLLTSEWRLIYDIGNFKFIGIIPIAIGLVFYILTAWDFAATGKGTPAPIDAPRVLVSKRLYRLTRNPMYTAVLLVLVGEAIFFVSLTLLIYTALVWSLFHLFVIYYEEPKLSKEFVGEYQKYLKAVPRWIPNLKYLKERKKEQDTD
jgi:protein-S-isoprenylcysteine O-methyltransferase Ste14